MTFLSRRARRFAAAIVLAACGVAPAWGANCNSAFGTLGTVVWLVTPSGCLPNDNILIFPSLQSALSNWKLSNPGTGTVIVIGGPNADGTGSTSLTGSVTIDLQTPNPPQIITAVPTNLSTVTGGQPEILISENGVSWTASNVFGGGSSVSLGNNVINTPYAIQVTSANVTLSGFSINDSGPGYNTAEVSLSGGGANVSNLNLSLEDSDNSRALDVESSGNTVSNSTVDVTDASNANYALTVGYDGSAVNNTFTGLNVSHINDDAAGFYTSSNTVAHSTFTSQAANASAMTMIGASSITITNSYISDPGGSGIYCNSGCGYLDVIGSTLAAGGSGNSALALNNAVGASISGSYLSGASSAYGAYIYNGSQFDSISQSTITASDPGAIALEVDGSSLTLINSYVDNTVLFSGVSGGTIAFSSITANGGPGGTALQLAGTSGVFVTNSFLNGASGTAAYLYDGSSGNTIAFSTMTGNYSGLFLENTGSNAVQNDSIYNSGGSGIVVDQGLGTTISNDFIQGSTGVFVDGSTDTVIDASQIIATGSGNLAWGVYFGFGGENLSMSADVVMPGASAQPFAGIDIDIGSGGLINISTNTVMSGSAGEGFSNGIYAAGPGQGGLQVWITSNTVVPAVPVTVNTVGIDINGLASGATIQDNDIYSGSPNGGPNSQYGIYGYNSPGLMINHNRIANPGMVQSGGGEIYLGLYLQDSNNADVEFNDFYATGTQAGSGILIQLQTSSNARVRNNIFASSFTLTSNYSFINMDNPSRTGFSSDYNDFFNWASGGLYDMFDIGGSLYSLGAWQALTYDAHSISANPLWNNTSAGVEDFHPLSQAGRYNPATGLFVPDAQTSLTIDHGDPLAPVASPFGLGTEPGPNGGRVNQGSYGETSQASESYGSCGAYPNTVYIPGDASTIQGGIGLLTQNMSGEECVYISTGGFYNEMVTVSGFTNNNSSITIAMDPRVSTAPTVLQGFNIQNASVTIANINIVPTVAELSAISISSPDVTIASVTVNDAAQKVSTYGIGFSGSYGTGFNLNVTVTGGVASALVVSGSSNTISLSVFSSQYYGAQFQGSYDTISQSTISSSGLGTYGLYFSAQHDTATLCSISAPNGVGADISGNFNAITNSTVTAANSGPGYGLWINGGSTNTITGDYISNSAYTSVLFNDGAYNNVGGSTIASGGITSSFALWFQGANHNTITGSLIENANNAGGAAVIQSGSSFNQINQSTMTTNAASAPALEITSASSNTLTGDYIVTPAVCPGGSTVNEAAYLFNADFNSISQSTMASNCSGSIGLGGATLYLSQSSSNTITRDMIINQTGDAIDLYDTASSNTISFSTGLAGTTGNGVFVDLSSSNTFRDDYLASPFPGGGYGFELLNSNGSTIYGSTVTNDSGGTNAALYLYGASSTTILFDTINDPSGYGLYLTGNSNTNDISSDTILSGSPGIVAALYLLDSSTNEIEGDSISGGVNGAYGVLLDVGANGNLISGSALANDSASNAALVIRGSSNIVTGSYVSDQNSGGLRIAYGSAGNSVVLSTITSVNAEGVSVSTGLNTSLFNDYIQGSTAVYVSGSTGTVIGGSVLVADGASANADGVRLTGGSVGLSLSSSVVTGGVHGAGVYLDQGDSGFIGLSTNTIQTGSQYGIYAGNAQSGARIWISSNTIIPTPAPGYPTYGLYLLSLPSGATVQNNGIYWRTIGPPTGTLSSYGLYAGSVPGLVVNHNRISDSGMILSGSVISIGLAGNSSEADIEFNDFFSTGGGANMIDAEMIDISASAGARVRNNIFSSSVTASGYVAISVEDGASESGYSSDYNDFFSSNAFNSAAWGGTTYSLLGPWQAGSNQDAHSLSANPLWANPAVGVEDFHPLSEKARYDPLDGQMDSQDTANSPTIDRGDPAAGLSSGIDLPPTYHGVEPLPNGGIPNQGSYGQTDQASESSSPCGQTYYVRTDGSTGLSTIQSGVNSIVSPVTGQACVYISDGGTYTAPVTVSGITFGDNNSRVVIAMDPLGSGPPTVTNSFTIQNASVTVANIEFAPFGGSYNYVIQASSPNVTIASVSVIDIGSHIGFAGIAISSWTTISNSSVSVANVYGIEALGSYDSIFYSTAVDNSANDSALYLDGASSGTYQGLFLSNASGSGAQLYGASNDMISLSTISDNGSSGAPGAVYLLNATSNSITQSYLQGSAAPALQISGSNSNTISFSTVTSASTAGNNPTIWWLSGSSNVFTDTYLGNSYPDGAGVGIVHGNSNTVSFSTITSLTNGIQWGVSGDNNLITQSYLDNPNGYAVEFLSGSSSNTISQSTAASDTSDWPAIFVNGASTVTISQSMIVNAAGDAVDIFGSNDNTISFSTITSLPTSGHYGLYLGSTGASSSNTVTGSYISGAVGLEINDGSLNNYVSQSTITTTQGPAVLIQASSNTVTRSYVLGGGSGEGAVINGGTGNLISYSTLSVAGGSDVLEINAGAANSTVLESVVLGASGAALEVDGAASGSAIIGSTMTSASGLEAVWLDGASTTTIVNSYIQGSTAVYVSGSTGTTIGGSVLASSGFGLLVVNGSQNLTLSTSTVIGSGQNRAAVAIAQMSNSGVFNISTNTIQASAATAGIYISTQSPGTQVFITSNTILPAAIVIPSNTPAYGIWIDGLATGATIYDNGIFYRTPGNAPGSPTPNGDTSGAIFAQAASGLVIEHNRISDPGVITGGNFAPIWFAGTTNSLIKFNDVNYTAPNTMTNAAMLLLQNGSAGATVEDNIFASSFTVTNSSASLVVDSFSLPLVCDYNDFFSSTTAPSASLAGGNYVFNNGWGGYDIHSISADPLWNSTAPGGEDFHPRSKVGRLTTLGYVHDAATSLTIDHGNPADSFNLESSPSGGIVNQGSYGDTADASLSPTAPTAPAVATTYQSSVTVSYQPVIETVGSNNISPDGYEVDASTWNGFTGTIVASQTYTEGTPQLALAPQGLSANTTYYFRVESLWLPSFSTASAVVVATATLANPPAALAPTFQAVGTTFLAPQWSANGNPVNVTTYTVVLTTGTFYPNSDTGNSTPLTFAPVTNPPLTTINSLLPNTTYAAFAAAVNWDGVPTTFVNLGSTSTYAALPSMTGFANVSSTTITINWTGNGDPAGTLYTVVTSTDPSFDSVATTSQTFNTFLSTAGLSAFTTYYFELEATNNDGVTTGFTAPTISTMTQPAVLSPPAPAGLIVNISSITATWSLSQGATGYGLVASVFPTNPPTSFTSSATLSCPGTCLSPSFTAGLSGLTPDTSYFIFVQALGADTATAFNVFPPTATLAAWPTATGSQPFASVLTTTMTVSWQANGNPIGSTYTVVLSSGSSYPNSYSGNIVLSTVDATGSPTFTFTNLPDNSSFTFFAAAVNWEGSSTPYVNLGSTVTLITTPTTVFLDDISSTSLVVSAYAPTPGLHNLGVGQSGTNEYDSFHNIFHGFHGEQWTAESPMSGAVSQLSVVALNGLVYAIDGYNGSSYTNAVSAYASGGGWTPVPITSQSRGDAAAAVLRGQIYVAGGSNNGGASSNPANEVYNAGAWSSTQPISNANADSYMAYAVLGNKLYAIGGYSSGQSLTTVNNVFDPTAGQWSTQASIPAGLAQAAAAAVSSDIYVLGGYNGSAATTGNYVYQGANDTWTTGAALPAPLYAAAAVELGGKIYLLGGTGDGSAPNAQTYVYDPSANQWATVTDTAMPTARWSLGAAESGGRIYAVGGTSNGSSALASNEQYDPGVATLITGLSPNNSYTFKAEARNQAGTVSGFSNTVTTYTLAALPTLDPTVFPDVSIGSATVQWDNGNNNPVSVPVTPYQVQASTAPSFASGATLLSSGWLSPVSFPTQGAVLSMLPNTTYYFQVQAENALGAPTLFVSLGSTSTLAAPPGPVVSTYSAVGANGFTMTWSSGTGAQGYNPAGTTYYAQVALSSTPFVAVQTATTTALSAAFAGLNINTLYFTQVEAVNNNGIPTGFVAFGDTATTVSAPVPTNSTSTFLPVYNSSLTVNWLAGGDPAGTTYYAQISSVPFPSASILASSQTFNTLAAFTGLAADTTYYLQAAAYSAALSTWTAFTNLGSTSTLAFAPAAAPFSSVSTSAIQANWLADTNPSSTTLYQLEASTSSSFSAVVTSSLTYNLFVDTTGLSVNTTYYFQVAAINNNGIITGFTPIFSTATLAVAPSTAPIANVTANSIQFNWTAAGNPSGTTYAALVSTDQTMGVDGSVVTTSDTFSTSLSTAGLAPATTYFFEAQTLGYNQATPLTAQISTMTLPALPGYAASTFTAVGAQALSLAWAANGNPQGTNYIVQLSTDAFNSVNESSVTYNLSASFGVGGSGPALGANTTYYLQVEAVDGSGASGFVTLGSTSTLVAPPGPAISTFTDVTSTSIQLDWSSGTAVTGFNSSTTVYLAQISTNNFATINATVQTQATYYAFTGLVINTQYYFQVESLGNAGETSDWVNYGSTATVTAPPSTTSPTFSPVYSSSLTVNWSADGDPAGTTYYVQLSTWNGFSGTIAASSITYNTFARFAGLGVNTTYYAEAAAYNLSNSTWTTFTNLQSTSTLAAQPSTSTIVSITTMSIKVSWTANGNPAGTLYDVQYSTSPNFSTIAASSLTYNLAASTCALAANTTYFIEVAAIDNDGILTGFASFGSTSTLVNVPSTAPFTSVSSTTIQFNWLSNSDSTSTVYTAFVSSDSAMGADGSIVTSSRTYSTFLSTAGLTPATTYFFQVEALGNNGVMTASTTVVSTMTLPALPTAGAFVGVSTHAVTAQWEQGGNPSGVMYVAQISTNNFATINASSCTYNLSISFGLGGFGASLIPNTTYSVRVEAADLSGASGFLVVGTTWTLVAPPAVQPPTFTGESPTSLSLIWSASGNPLAETTYTIVLTTDTAGYPNSYTGNVTLSTAPAGSSPSAVVGGLIGATTYYAWVDAVGNDGLATAFVAMSSAVTVASSSPTITDSQAGDLVWRTTNNGQYNVGAFNTGSGILSYFAIEASTAPGGGGPFETGLTQVVTGIGAGSYSNPWSLPASFFNALANGPTNYITFQAVDTNGNATTQADVFFIKKDTTVPGFANAEAGGVPAVSTAAGTLYMLQSTETASGLAGFQYSASLNASGDASLIPWTDIESTSAIYGSTASVAGWQISWAALSATTTNYISVRAWNVAGATATLDNAFYVIKDTAGPITSISSPDQAFLSAISTITGAAMSGFPLQGTEVSIAQLGSPTYYWNPGGSAFNSASPVWLPVVSSGTISYWSMSTAGITFVSSTAYEVVARSSDTAGLYTQNYSTVVFTFDQAVPAVVVSTPANGVIVSTVLYSISGTAVDPPPDSGISTVQIELKRLDTGQWWNFFTDGWQPTAVATTVFMNTAAGSAASTWTYHTDQSLRGALAGGTSYFIAAAASDQSFPPNTSGFSQGGSTFTFSDQEAPAAVTNLAGQPGIFSGQIALTWTAAGNNKGYGLLFSGKYAIGYSTYSTFAFSTAAAQVAFSTSGISAGSLQSYTVGSGNGLTAGDTYYLAIWTQNASGNWSPLSDLATAQATPAPPDEIAGEVLNVSTQGITGVEVDAFNSQGAQVESVFTAADGSGTYVLTGLASSSYTLTATWSVNGEESSVSLGDVPLSSGVDFVLNLSYTLGALTGQFASSSAPPSSGGGLGVSSYRPSASGPSQQYVEVYSRNKRVVQIYPDTTGKWTVPNLLPGPYSVRAFNGLDFTPFTVVNLQEGQTAIVSFSFDPLPSASVYAFPNPARTATTIRFQTALLPLEAEVEIFDVAGNLVYQIPGSQIMAVGSDLYHASWPLVNSQGQGVASGIYLAMVKIKGGADNQTAQVITKIAVVK